MTVEAMANAVENSELVLVCVTKEYKKDFICQAEAQYAFALKKKIIPVIMQTGLYSDSGWLDKIMNRNKIELPDAAFDGAFDQQMKNLINEIKLLG